MYKVIEKTHKVDGLGVTHNEIWLKDITGFYSLLRVSDSTYASLELGDKVDVSLTIVKEI